MSRHISSATSCIILAMILTAFLETSTASSEVCRKPAQANTMGNCIKYNIQLSYDVREFFACIPSTPETENAASLPLILNFHGWTTLAVDDISDAGYFMANISAIIVHPQGYADNNMEWGSWHAFGSVESPSSIGPTCLEGYGNTSWCYDSCLRRPQGCDTLGCDFTTCVDDFDFVDQLIERLKDIFCVDTTRMYVSGISNGGIFAYSLAAIRKDLAAVVPVAGSFMKGFLRSPSIQTGMPIMDIHGTSDQEVPINMTTNNTRLHDFSFPLSDDGWYYHSFIEIAEAWKISNQCTGSATELKHYNTTWEGYWDLWCVEIDGCQNGSVVRCSWNGEHDYYSGSDNGNNALLAWEFMSKHRRVSDSIEVLN